MSRRLSLIKSVTWRVIALLLTFIISMILTGKIEISLPIAIFDGVTKFVAYYFHERVWLRFRGMGA